MLPYCFFLVYLCTISWVGSFESPPQRYLSSSASSASIPTIGDDDNHQSNAYALQSGIIITSPNGGIYRLEERVRRIGSPTTKGGLILRPSKRDRIDAATSPVTSTVREENEANSFDDVLLHEAIIPARRKPLDHVILAEDGNRYSPSPPKTVDTEMTVDPKGYTGGTDGNEKSNEPTFSSSSRRWSLEDLYGRGRQGEVWRAVKLDEYGNPDGIPYVMKRIFGHVQGAVLSGWREIHFGTLTSIQRDRHMVRFIEYFQRQPSSDESTELELWLVFRDEGISLQRLLFLPIMDQSSTASRTSTDYRIKGALAPSAFWVRLRTLPAGKAVFAAIVKQLFEGLHTLHRSSIIHRDIKPGNILVNTVGNTIVLKYGDFGSAIDKYAYHHLYPSPEGPTIAEETPGYVPPEVVRYGIPYANTNIDDGWSYDIFSIGVTLLEILLGLPSSSIFVPDPRVEALIYQKFSIPNDVSSTGNGNGNTGGHTDLAIRLAGFFHLCIQPNITDIQMDPVLSKLYHLEYVAHARRHHHQDSSHGSDGSNDSAHSGGECNLESFRYRLRKLNHEAQQRAIRLANAAASSSSSSAEGSSSSSTGNSDYDDDDLADTYALWRGPLTSTFSPTVHDNQALVTYVGQRSHEASYAAFGEFALVPVWGALVVPETTVSTETNDGAIERIVKFPELPMQESATAASTAESALLLTDGEIISEDVTDSDVPSAPYLAPPKGSSHETEEETVRNTPVPLLGLEGEEFLYHILQWYPLQRLTTSQALHHPYLQK